MDFLKKTISDAGDRAAKEAMVDQASSTIKGALGGDNAQLVDQASSYVKQSLNNNGQQTTKTTESTFVNEAQELIKETVTKQTTTTNDNNNNNNNNNNIQEKTTVKTDYIDKGISMVEEKVFNISADKQNQETNEKIAGFVRAGIEKYTENNNKNN